MNRIISLLLVLVFAAGSFAQSRAVGDWPQWRGANRDGISKETGLLKSWPEGGPKVVWSITGLGEGYGSVATVGDRLYVQGVKGTESVVYCLNRNDGKTLWVQAIGARLDQDRGGGPRGTPTVDGDRLYVLTENGDLACLRARDGAITWKRNMLTDFKGSNPNWRISESPLIDGNRVIVTPGGSGAGVVALDKMTGATVWTSAELSDGAHYTSSVVADVGGVRTIMTMTANAAVGLRASDGKLMWRYTQVANKVANITTPVFFDNKVFFTTAYDTGAALLSLKPAGGEVKAEQIYFTREMMNHHGGVVLVNGYLYGFSNAILTCIEFSTGKVMWKDRSVGKGSVVYADGQLYLFGEKNVVGLADATPEGYREKGRFTVADQGWPSWAHPVVSGGKLFIRNQGVLTCYEVKAS